MSYKSEHSSGDQALTRRRFGLALLSGSAAILGLAVEEAHAEKPVAVPAPKRFASGVADGHLRPTVCGGPGRSCSSGVQLDALLAAVDLRRGVQAGRAQLQGVFALKGGFVVTVRAFDVKSNGRWFGEGYRIDGCRVELVDIAIAITDSRLSRAEFEEIYLFKMKTDTLDLTPDQRSKQANGSRYVTAAVRVEVHCLVPDRRYTANLRRSETPAVLERYLPGLSAVAVID